MTLQDFYDLCAKHDWYYQFSDSPEVYDRGRREADVLAGLARNNPERSDMLAAFGRWAYSGPAWQTEREPRPERPLPGSVPVVHPDQLTLAGI